MGRARRLATDPEAAQRRAEVLRLPARITYLGTALSSAAGLVKAAEQEAAAVTEELNTPERDALRKAFGEGSTGKGVAKAVRGSAGALKDLEDRQKSRVTRLKRDALDRALLDLAAFYRDVLVLQLGADVDLASAGHEEELHRLAAASPPESTVRRMEAIMTCRERLELNVAPLLAVEEMAVALLAPPLSLSPLTGGGSPGSGSNGMAARACNRYELPNLGGRGWLSLGDGAPGPTAREAGWTGVASETAGNGLTPSPAQAARAEDGQWPWARGTRPGRGPGCPRCSASITPSWSGWPC